MSRTRPHGFAAREPTGQVISLAILGQPVDVTVRDEDARRQLALAWSRCLRPAPREAGQTSEEATLEELPDLAEGTSVTQIEADEDLVAFAATDVRLLSRLTHLGISALSGRAVLLQAAGLSRSNGQVIGLLAPTGTGASTAAATLGLEGFGYVTDELLAILPGFDVLPFEKPLTLPLPGRPGKVSLGPDLLHLTRPPTAPLRLARLVLLDRDPDLEGIPRSEPLPLVETILELVARTKALAALPRPLQSLAELFAHTRPVRVTYREAADLVPCLDALLAEAAPERAADIFAHTAADIPDTPVDGDVRASWSTVDLGELPQWAGVSDGLRIGSTVLLLVGQQPIVLRGMAAIVWEAGGQLGTIEAVGEEWIAPGVDPPETTPFSVLDSVTQWDVLVDELRRLGALTDLD